MPVHMRRIASGKHKGKYVVVEPNGRAVTGPLSKGRARKRVQAQNLNTMRRKGDRRAPARRRRR